MTFNKMTGQEDLIVSHSRFMQKVNPSAFGMNNINKTGVLYNSQGMVSNSRIESQYFFGAISFDNDDFSIGLDVYSLKMDDTGLVNTKPTLSYIYKIQLDNELYFLPSLSIGFGSSRFDSTKLIFEDQLSAISGFLQAQSNDPILQAGLGSANYIDLGASFLVHSSNYLFGISVKHLNQPDISYNNESSGNTDDSANILPIKYSLQGGYEFDINPFGRSIMPRYSTVYSFVNLSRMGNDLDIFLSQEVQLGSFSMGINQQFRNTSSFVFTNFGLSVAVAYENFEFGALYNFPFRNQLNTAVYSPSTIEVFLTFDFSPYLRNKRGDYRRISIDNYY